MTRLFIDDLSDISHFITLEKKNSHYVSKVLRCSSGDELVLFDGSGKECRCIVSAINTEVTLRVKDIKTSDIQPLKYIILLQGLLKGKKMDLIVQKTTEVGIKKIIPVITERSQIRRTSKRERWQKIAHDASRQCGRTDIVEISDAIAFDDLLFHFLPYVDNALKVVFYEKSSEPLYRLEEKLCSKETTVIFTGPEGGFTEDEIQTLKDKGFYVSGLGDFVLRAETAAIVSTGIVQYISSKSSSTARCHDFNETNKDK